ncbi:MAG: hypothetical protein HC782_03430, partial [Gammaproteobacteria bacterium]|nr:hypothetical protein [Gammaproteobacteria bacterium]
WVKLAFLAALGICTATFLSFPVACLLSFTVFLAGMLGPYLADSLIYWYDPELKELDFTTIKAAAIRFKKRFSGNSSASAPGSAKCG